MSRSSVDPEAPATSLSWPEALETQLTTVQDRDELPTHFQKTPPDLDHGLPPCYSAVRLVVPDVHGLLAVVLVVPNVPGLLAAVLVVPNVLGLLAAVPAVPNVLGLLAVVLVVPNVPGLLDVVLVVPNVPGLLDAVLVVPDVLVGLLRDVAQIGFHPTTSPSKHVLAGLLCGSCR